ncbi:O-methyltransferase [Bhargavaea cecembensis]|uniref:O-methyltransferase n=1 Tax=Bhargavaea cecembensis TaxID=394098 RepID=UPI0005909D5B|nr:O-methyltransferase [Bhargavaea cecembensis]
MKKINEYVDEVFGGHDPVLEEVRESIRKNGMPSISVSPSSGRLLTMLVQISGARKILEIGALGGYSGICLARGFGSGGRLTSLELKEEYAELAGRNLERAGFGGQVGYMTGPALESLRELADKGERFDFFFIDADKESYHDYLEACIRIAKPGALIVADNVLARGSVADPDSEQRRYTETMRTFNKKVAAHLRLESTLIPTGDGLTLSRVKG